MIRKIDRIEPYQRAISKAHLAAAGIDLEALDCRPLIAVANSWNELCPGHEPLRKLAEEVKKGIIEAGGEPIEFNTVAMCDGIAQGHPGMRYCLPHRELITDSIEAMVSGEGIFDGIVFLGSCDKIIPGMLNAAARLNLPAVMVTAGPCYAEIRPSDSKEARQKFLRHEITERELIETTLKYYTGPGVCPFLGTANTMACLCEALGIMLPGGSLIPSGTSMRRFQARQSGRAVMRMVNEGICARDILTKEALENAAVLLSAIGGSLNALLHLPALAHELGFRFGWDDMAAITQKTPVLTGITPNGNKTVIELYQAGGIPSILKELRGLLKPDALTVCGKTIGQVAQEAKTGDRSTICAFDAPIQAADGIQVLYGNIAPGGALVKTSAVPMELREFTGSAKVFESEQSCYAAFRENRIHSGDVLVIRYEGPKGGPGMRELHRVTEILKGIPGTAILTDGRFSGASGGLSVGCVSPEAFERGPIAFVKDGDRIEINLKKGTVSLLVSEEELSTRTPEILDNAGSETGYLKRYARSVGCAQDGAVLGEYGFRLAKSRPAGGCSLDSAAALMPHQ